MKFDVKNKVALVTGANRGIGKVIVDTLFENGAGKVYLAVRNPDSARTLVDTYGDRAVPIHIDLANPQTIIEAAKIAADVQLVINNAGILNNVSPLDEDAIDLFQEEMNINVYALMRMARAFAPVLKANGGGAFVQLNSVASMKCFADFVTYSASKAAAYSVTQGLREKLEQQGTLVVSVHPGPIDTEMAHNAGLGELVQPPELVSDAIIGALARGDFHVFPDAMAGKIGEQYRGYAENIIEVNLMEE